MCGGESAATFGRCGWRQEDTTQPSALVLSTDCGGDLGFQVTHFPLHDGQSMLKCLVRLREAIEDAQSASVDQNSVCVFVLLMMDSEAIHLDTLGDFTGTDVNPASKRVGLGMLGIDVPHLLARCDGRGDVALVRVADSLVIVRLDVVGAEFDTHVEVLLSLGVLLHFKVDVAEVVVDDREPWVVGHLLEDQ